jgi:agmatinase
MNQLPYVGISTFARAKHQPLETPWTADVGILGIPFDIALGFRPGARFAPRVLREASLRYALPKEGFYNLHTNIMHLAGLELADAGDVNLPSLEPELSRTRITEAAIALCSRVKFPIFLGGDHSVTYPILRAYSNVSELHIVQFDAHLDFTNSRNDTHYSNSSPFRRATEEMPNLTHITTLGLRGLRFDQEAVQAAKTRGHTLIPMQEITNLELIISRLPLGKNVYISFDVDVLEPSLIPATSSPEPEGMGFGMAVTLLEAVATRNTILGFDLVEFAPNLDSSGNSGLFLARLIMEFLKAVIK